MNIQAIVGVLIPVVAIVLGIGFVAFVIFLEFYKRRHAIELLHAERMAAIEKGIELPPLPEDYLGGGGSSPSARRSGRRSALRTGLILTFLGSAITLALWGSGLVGSLWWWGLVPLGLGLAFLATSWLEVPASHQPGE
jgi:hypothetical protein